jgi:hypothetical protein
VVVVTGRDDCPRYGNGDELRSRTEGINQTGIGYRVSDFWQWSANILSRLVTILWKRA